MLTTRDIIDGDHPEIGDLTLEEGWEDVTWVRTEDVDAAIKSLRSSLAFAAPELQDFHWQVFRERVVGA